MRLVEWKSSIAIGRTVSGSWSSQVFTARVSGWEKYPPVAIEVDRPAVGARVAARNAVGVELGDGEELNLPARTGAFCQLSRKFEQEGFHGKVPAEGSRNNWLAGTFLSLRAEKVAVSDQTSERGRESMSPWRMPLAAWKDVVVRTHREAAADNVGLIAAGVAFYGFLALVPLLGATVLTYGLVAEPATVLRDMQRLTTMLPAEIAGIVGDQLLGVVQTSERAKGLGLLVALGVALFGARNAAGAIITSLNIAYEEEEKRGFIGVTLLALGITAGAVLSGVVALLAVTVLGYLENLLPGSNPVVLVTSKMASYLLLALAASAAAAALYRYGPSRDQAKWVWLTPGSLLFALSWMILTLGFGFYVANFGNYGATYGSLSAVVVLLTWLYLSSYALLFGAELNSELEHQTARDTTTGPEQPMGERGAWAADNVTSGTDDPDSQESGGGR